MSNILGLSSASFCLWDIDAAKKISICKRLGFERIEIALSTIRMLKEFVANAKYYDELREFNNITIHAPWCGILYGDNTKARTVMNYLQQLDNIFCIRYYIFHYDCIIDFDFINKSYLPICVENSEKIGTWFHFEKAVDKYDCRCALNINRAVRNENYLEKILKRFEHKIEIVHISGFAKDKYRIPFLLSGQDYLLDEVGFLPVPFIIEGLFSPNDYLSILKEKELISKKLSIN
jgi:hypothetical protein